MVLTDDELLAEATEMDGRPRFYRPGLHPATYRLRKHREAVKASPWSEEVQAMLDHIDGQLAIFEAGEDRAKRDYLRVRRDQLERDASA